MRFLKQLFEADRKAGQPLWFYTLLFVSLLRPGAGFSATNLSAQSPWAVAGPPGGDAREFASVPGQPNHLYLGTTSSWLYESLDGGSSWHRLVRLDGSNNLILDHIVVDAADTSTIFVAAWRDADGGLWVSHDRGHVWNEVAGLHGQSIRSFIQSPSNPRVLLAGTLQGVFRSNDEGATWARISPPSEPLSHEIHEVESLAIDPSNPDIIYAGTWHLPWKTTDGGENWQSIKQGIIDDSDVFSIILDSEDPRTVFLSACTGIYKSESAGVRFQKIEGIPSTARRTRVLRQDPEDRQTVYAGTTEGLYQTLDGGKSFKRITGPEVIVNDVFVDPRDSNHVLLATDRAGVLVSSDAGKTFVESNQGFSQRKVAALLVDSMSPSRLYAGIVNDKTFGGVFVSADHGATWNRIATGLDGRDVFALSQSKDGTVMAGTSHGIFVLDPPANSNPAAGPPSSSLTWEARNLIANTLVKASTETHYKTHVNVETQVKAPATQLDGRVSALDVSGDVWLAATGSGLLTSRNQGASWQGGPVLGVGEFLSVTVHGALMAAARADSVVFSHDDGRSWWPMGLPTMLTRIHRVLFDQDGTLWLGAREGVYFSKDQGKTWLWIERLPFRDVDDLEYDLAQRRVLVSSQTDDQVFSIDPKTMTWSFWHTGYRMAQIRVAGDRLVAASLDDGVLIGPQTVNQTK